MAIERHPPAATETEDDQLDVEKTLRKCFDKVLATLEREVHIQFLKSSLSTLPQRWQGLDSSRPWLTYWMLHAADVLHRRDDLLLAVPAAEIGRFLLLCFGEDVEPTVPGSRADAVDDHARLRKGFGGGPGQPPHLAASLAAVCALTIAQAGEALQQVDRPAVQRWLVSLRTPDGGFRMHRGGEVDLRAVFCATVVAHLLHLDIDTVLPASTKAYLVRNQTYEGGFGSCGDGGAEAHGGYTQCAVAACLLLGCHGDLDLDRLRRFCALRQLDFEGGFCGRANKLVDSCYTFWIGSSFTSCQTADAVVRLQRGAATPNDMLLLHHAQLVDLASMDVNLDALDPGVGPSSNDGIPTANHTPPPSRGGEERQHQPTGSLLYNQQDVLQYVLQCCQGGPQGGLKDKPSAGVDFYHTCYSLSGASLASNNHVFGLLDAPTFATSCTERGWLPSSTALGSGDEHTNTPRSAVEDAVYRAQVLPYAGADDHGQEGPWLQPVNPLFNVCRRRVDWVYRLFRPQAASAVFLR